MTRLRALLEAFFYSKKTWVVIQWDSNAAVWKDFADWREIF